MFTGLNNARKGARPGLQKRPVLFLIFYREKPSYPQQKQLYWLTHLQTKLETYSHFRPLDDKVYLISQRMSNIRLASLIE